MPKTSFVEPCKLLDETVRLLEAHFEPEPEEIDLLERDDCWLEDVEVDFTPTLMVPSQGSENRNFDVRNFSDFFSKKFGILQILLHAQILTHL